MSSNNSDQPQGLRLMYHQVYQEYPFLRGIVAGSILLQASTNWTYTVFDVNPWFLGVSETERAVGFVVTAHLGGNGMYVAITERNFAEYELVSSPVELWYPHRRERKGYVVNSMTGEAIQPCTLLPWNAVVENPEVVIHHHAGGDLRVDQEGRLIIMDEHDAVLSRLEGTCLELGCDHVQ